MLSFPVSGVLDKNTPPFGVVFPLDILVVEVRGGAVVNHNVTALNPCRRRRVCGRARARACVCVSLPGLISGAFYVCNKCRATRPRLRRYDALGGTTLINPLQIPAGRFCTPYPP